MDANDLQSLDRERGKGRYQISCFPRRWHREERNKALRNGAIAACAYFKSMFAEMHCNLKTISSALER